MIKAIFWDNDGVLVDTERLYFRATQHVLATVGIPLTKEQYIDLFLVQGKGAWHLAADKGLPTICQPQFVTFLPHLHDRLTTNPACIIACTITQHGYQDTQQSVANSA
jgi:beta-phosphoglucomutase-like phosphatase (HAD superfamily)